MKTRTKLLMILLTAFCLIPTCKATAEKKKEHSKFYPQTLHHKDAITRLPIDYTIEATGDENSLQIIFLFPMQEADITLTDKNGNVVIEENQVNSYEGKTLYVPAPKAYPYTLVLTSPAVDITGEITLEEEN